MTALENAPGAATLVHAIVPDALDAVSSLADPVARADAAEDAIAAANALRGELARARRDAVRELRGSSRPPLRSWAQVGELIGTTGARAQQIADMPSDRNAPRGPRTSGPPPFAPELADAPRHPLEPS